MLKTAFSRLGLKGESFSHCCHSSKTPCGGASVGGRQTVLSLPLTNTHTHTHQTGHVARAATDRRSDTPLCCRTSATERRWKWESRGNAGRKRGVHKTPGKIFYDEDFSTPFYFSSYFFSALFSFHLFSASLDVDLHKQPPLQRLGVSPLTSKERISVRRRS